MAIKNFCRIFLREPTNLHVKTFKNFINPSTNPKKTNGKVAHNSSTRTPPKGEMKRAKHPEQKARRDINFFLHQNWSLLITCPINFSKDETSVCTDAKWWCCCEWCVCAVVVIVVVVVVFASSNKHLPAPPVFIFRLMLFFCCCLSLCMWTASGGTARRRNAALKKCLPGG